MTYEEKAATLATRADVEAFDLAYEESQAALLETVNELALTEELSSRQRSAAYENATDALRDDVGADLDRLADDAVAAVATRPGAFCHYSQAPGF